MLKEKSTLESSVGSFDKTLRGLDDAQVLFELATEAHDADSICDPVEFSEKR